MFTLESCADEECLVHSLTFVGIGLVFCKHDNRGPSTTNNLDRVYRDHLGGVILNVVRFQQCYPGSSVQGSP